MNQLPVPAAEPRVIYVERQGREKYTYYDNGIVKITRYKAKQKIYWGRIIAASLVFILLFMGIVQTFRAAAAAIRGRKNDDKTTPSSSLGQLVPQDKNDDLTVSEDSASGSADSNISTDKSEIALTICIDPAHGGAADRGAVSADGEIIECEQNLELAELVKEYLTDRGATVIITRESDEQLVISDRCSLANQAGADFYVSLHRNSVSGDDTLCGTEVWVNNNQPEYDTLLAENILAAVEKVGISENRGVKFGYSGIPDQNYQVNIDTVMPSCLLELGFLTNETDNRMFEEHKEEYAQAIGDAIIKTAIDIGVIDKDGKRLMSDQLISYGKNSVVAAY